MNIICRITEFASTTYRGTRPLYVSTSRFLSTEGIHFQRMTSCRRDGKEQRALSRWRFVKNYSGEPTLKLSMKRNGPDFTVPKIPVLGLTES
ncbi:hypothetical protein AVEN_66420-1 [Araneus ventricosus]|uniref:Uncharacterized protein n=1 Tax=Araneus ventricosus TaxID=182803 RepID=A0A4Y2ELX1_ARAVE|nr:hypothetical protein AVEN_66420-1 [Araneus ventricosus]